MAASTPARKPSRYLRARFERVAGLFPVKPPGAFVLDVSRSNQARASDTAQALRMMQHSNPAAYTIDALIGATTLVDGSVLVTTDTKVRLSATVQGVKVLSPLDLLTDLGYRPTDA